MEAKSVTTNDVIEIRSFADENIKLGETKKSLKKRDKARMSPQPSELRTGVVEIDNIGDYEGRFFGKLHEFKTRQFITATLLISIISIIGIPITFYLIKPSILNEKVLDFVKWAVQILTPLLGTAIGFYFGGMNAKITKKKE